MIARHLLAAMSSSLALALATEAASAQTLPTLPPPAAPASSTATLASQLVGVLTAPPAPELGGSAALGGARVAIAVTLTAEGARGAELGAFVADAIEARLSAMAGFGRRVASDEEATERIEVALAVSDGHLQATARRRALPKNLWEVIAGGTGRVLATAYANVPIDLELRSLLGLGRRDVRLDALRVVPVAKKSLPALMRARALDCAIADLDGDRDPELAVLQSDALRAVRWTEGGFSRELGAIPLEVVPPSEAPLREPLGRVLIVTREGGDRVLVAASSDRAEPLVAGLGAAGLHRLALTFQAGWPLYVTGADRFVAAPWPRAIDSLEGGLTEARLGAGGATWIGEASRVHDVRAFAAGGRGAIVAALVGGGVRILPGGDVAQAGTVSALIDFDADGASELLTSSQALSGPDRLTLSRAPGQVGGRTAGATLWMGSVPAPVTAMCAGDVDRDGYDEVIVATWDGLLAELIIVVPR